MPQDIAAVPDRPVWQAPPRHRDARRPVVVGRQGQMQVAVVAGEQLLQVAGAGVDGVYIGWRPLPLDGHPVLGAAPGRPDVYIAITHSGVSLAPIVGQFAANEIVSGETLPRLDVYRPDRDFELMAPHVDLRLWSR